MSDGSRFPRILALGLALMFALGCAAAAAQSGRRAKSPPPSATDPTPEPTAAPDATPDSPKPTLRLVVGIERFDGFSSVSLNAYNGVLPSCADRLKSPAVSVVPVERPLSRAEAMNRAKVEKAGYVVWLNVRENNLSSSRTGTANNAYIEYMVFAPITAKVVSSGSAYPRSRAINPGRTIGVNGDPEFNEAARGVAIKILAALQSHIPTHIF